MTRKEAVRQLLDAASTRLGSSDWSVAGGTRLRAKISDEVEGVILPLAAGYASYTVSIAIGPRFPSIERTVARASRAAGQSEAGIRTAANFPTVFQRLSEVSPLSDHAPLQELSEIVEALHLHAVPFIRNLGTMGAAAEYALTNALAYGAHALRIPVLLANIGRRKEAEDYLDKQTDQTAPYSEFMARYRDAVLPLL